MLKSMGMRPTRCKDRRHKLLPAYTGKTGWVIRPTCPSSCNKCASLEPTCCSVSNPEPGQPQYYRARAERKCQKAKTCIDQQDGRMAMSVYGMLTTEGYVSGVDCTISLHRRSCKQHCRKTEAIRMVRSEKEAVSIHTLRESDLDMFRNGKSHRESKRKKY